MSNSLEEFAQDVGQGIVNIILYIPRRIYGHFKYIKDLEKENKTLEEQIHERDLIFRRIKDECESNSYGNQSLKLRKLKELAETFPQEQS